MSIVLEPLTAAHLEGVRALADDPDVQRFTRVRQNPPAGFAESWIARYEEGRRAGTCEGFAILDAGDGAFLGLAVVPAIDRTARTAELGYVTSPAARGRGVATEALRALTDWAFEAGMLRLELLIDAANDASRRVAERCGYVREGLLRSKHVKADLRADTELWSRLPTDPQASPSGRFTTIAP